MLDKIDINQFKNIVDTYSDKRNKAAHTHTVGTTTTYDAPSTILNDYRRIKPIITTIEQEVCSLVKHNSYSLTSFIQIITTTENSSLPHLSRDLDI